MECSMMTKKNSELLPVIPFQTICHMLPPSENKNPAWTRKGSEAKKNLREWIEKEKSPIFKSFHQRLIWYNVTPLWQLL